MVNSRPSIGCLPTQVSCNKSISFAPETCVPLSAMLWAGELITLLHALMALSSPQQTPLTAVGVHHTPNIQQTGILSPAEASHIT